MICPICPFVHDYRALAREYFFFGPGGGERLREKNFCEGLPLPPKSGQMDKSWPKYLIWLYFSFVHPLSISGAFWTNAPSTWTNA